MLEVQRLFPRRTGGGQGGIPHKESCDGAATSSRETRDTTNSACAIVTGSTGGIGLDIAGLLAAQGTDIILDSINEADEIEVICRCLAVEHGGKANAIHPRPSWTPLVEQPINDPAKARDLLPDLDDPRAPARGSPTSASPRSKM